MCSLELSKCELYFLIAKEVFKMLKSARSMNSSEPGPKEKQNCVSSKGLKSFFLFLTSLKTHAISKTNHGSVEKNKDSKNILLCSNLKMF